MNIFDDWRYRGQKEYLANRTFRYGKANIKEHDHCEFCYEKFMKNDNKIAYMTLDDYHVVCEQCYEDFKTALNFKKYDEKNFEKRQFSQILHQEASTMLFGKNIYQINSILSLANNLSEVRLSREKLLIVPCLEDYKCAGNNLKIFSDYAIEVVLIDKVTELVSVLHKIKKDFKDKETRGITLDIIINSLMD